MLQINITAIIRSNNQSRLFTVPYFSVGFSRLVRFDGAAAILVCKSERDLGRVSKLPRGAGEGDFEQSIIKDWGVRLMISIPGSLSFAKLVMMSSALQNLRGMPDTRPNHSLICSFVECPIQSRLQSVLGVRSFRLRRTQ